MAITMARHEKRSRQQTRVLKTLTVAGIVGALVLGPTSMAAMANDTPAEDETNLSAPVETTPIEQVTTEPTQEVIDTPAEPVAEKVEVVETPAEEAPAPTPDTPSKVVVEEPVPVAEKVEVVETPAEPAPVEEAPVHITTAPTSVTPIFTYDCKQSEGGVGYSFFMGFKVEGNDTVFDEYDDYSQYIVISIVDNDNDDAIVTITPRQGYVVTPDSALWVRNGDGSATVNATLLGDEKCSKSDPVIVTGSAVFNTASCENPKNSIDTDKVPGGVWVLTDKNGGAYTGALGAEVDETKVPGGLAYGDITVQLRDGDETDNYTVAPWEGVWKTVDPASLNCNPYPEPEVVIGTATFQTLSCTEGSKNWTKAKATPGGVWSFTDVNGKTFMTEVGDGYAGGVPEGLAFGVITVTLADANEADNYSVTPWGGTWKTVNPTSLACTTPTPTPPPTVPTPMPPTTTPIAVVLPVVANPATPPKTSSSYVPPRVLATTGSDAGGIGALSAAAVTFLLGGFGALRMARRKMGEGTL